MKKLLLISAMALMSLTAMAQDTTVVINSKKTALVVIDGVSTEMRLYRDPLNKRICFIGNDKETMFEYFDEHYYEAKRQTKQEKQLAKK